MTELRKQNEEQLNARREKLVTLLSLEEKQYEQEFFANLETPEQVREKMAKRLNELKSKREDMRKEEVERKLEARFRQGADELRKLDSKFTAANTKFEQEQQMLEKVNRLEDGMKGKIRIIMNRGANVCETMGG
jgi:DNA repair exonuclease SbcCD ATPase subunit